MKRIKPARLKTTVIGRNGKRYMFVPVSCSSKIKDKLKANKPANSAESTVNSVQDNSCFDNPSPSAAASSGTGLSAHHRRQIQLSNNWAKVREKIFDVYIEESSLPSGSQCVICGQHHATIRCKDCGPRGFDHGSTCVIHVLRVYTPIEINFIYWSCGR